ncbi:hypothetical protein ACI7RC_09575 [Brevibacillus sp. B_LB10_24]|uniref:hypothetical protein n=1 Tax=Brevibacillus sp. B_LB10_24 TaxID=3380645 RepID=UPI0038B7E4B6
MFENALRTHVGEPVEVITPLEMTAGVLMSVSEGSVTVRTPGVGYGNPKDVAIPTNSIAYVRLFT